MIEVRALTKRYERTLAVNDLSFQVRPGCVTGFLGPNGAGKSTTIRVLMGLDAPSAGEALVGGRRYAELRRPLHEVGALLDANAVHGGRSAFDHLLGLALTNGIGRRRVAETLEQVGLAGVARKRVGGYSLGMRQRLGIAAALLGDPGILLFDEPVNGLDPEGVRWIRELLRGLAAAGRTVLVSSHLMSEVEQTADHLVIIGRGRLIEDATVRDLADRFQTGVLVRSPRAAELASALESSGASVTAEPDGGLSVTGLDVAGIADAAAQRAIPLHEVTARRASLEDIYLLLTAGSVEHRSRDPRPAR